MVLSVAQVPRAVATVAEKKSPQSRLNRSTKVAKLELLASSRSTKAALKLEAMTA